MQVQGSEDGHLSDRLQDLLQNLASEGTRDSGGIFTLAAEKVSQRYRSLLERNPELPWLRFLQYAYRVQARRYRCVMSLSQCRLSLAGSQEQADIIDSLRKYPLTPNGDSGVLHQVVWLFLAEQPLRQALTVRLPHGHLRLEVGPTDFALSEGHASVEEDLLLEVDWSSGWLGVFHEAARRASVQREMARRLTFFPGVVEWDGGLKPQPLSFPGRPRLVIATPVARTQSDRIPHFACPEMSAARLCLNAESMRETGVPRPECDWLVLQSRQLNDYELSGDRWRVRLLFVYSVSSEPAQFLPMVDGCLLEAMTLEGWPPGIKLMAACPPDIGTDYSGLKVVNDDSLKGFLDHLRRRYAECILQLASKFECPFSPLGDWLSASSNA